MLSSGLELGLPEATAGMKKPLQDPRGAWKETWTRSSRPSFGFGSHGVPATAKGVGENSARSSTHCPGRSAQVCLANTHKHGLHAQKRSHTGLCAKLQKGCHWHRDEGGLQGPVLTLCSQRPFVFQSTAHGGLPAILEVSPHSHPFQQPLEAQCPVTFQLGTLAQGNGVQSKGRIEPGRLKPWALQADTQLGCLSTPAPPPSSPLFPVPQTGLLHEQADHSHTSGLCLLPALCCIGISFARHSLGFCGLGFGPSHFSLGAASWPKGKGRPQSAEVAMGGPRLGRGAPRASPATLRGRPRAEFTGFPLWRRLRGRGQIPGAPSPSARLQTPGGSLLKPRAPAQASPQWLPRGRASASEADLIRHILPLPNSPCAM